MAITYGKNYGRPTLDLNFAENKSLIDSVTGRNLITFSRSQSGKEATYVGSDGLIKYAGADEPRFDYDPTTGESLGLLVEESRTNLINFSEDFDTFFGKYDGGIGSIPSVTANSGLAPDGQLTADRIVFSLNGGTSTSDISEIRKNINVTTESHTFSFYIRSFDGASSYEMTLRDANGFINAFTVTGEWERITFTSPNYIAGSIPVGFGLRGGSFADSDSADILVWGAQLEAGAFPTSYIPTSGSTVTRNADEASITGSNFSSWYNQSKGTYFVDAITLDGSTSSSTTQDNIIDDGFVYIQDYVGGIVRRRVIAASNGSFNFNPTQSPTNKVAVAFDSTSANASYSGVLQTLDTSVTGLPNTSSSLVIGLRTIGIARMDRGHIGRITYWPKRLPDLELQQLTK